MGPPLCIYVQFHSPSVKEKKYVSDNTHKSPITAYINKHYFSATLVWLKIQTHQGNKENKSNPKYLPKTANI